MRVRVDRLRSLIREAVHGRGIRLIRAGGLSPVKQTHGSAPERFGVWAFVWPYAEPFLMGSTGPEGADPGEGKTRYDQLQREGWRKFVHSGVLYTRLHVPGAQEVNGWFKTDGASLAAYMGKHFTRQAMYAWKTGMSPDVRPSNPWHGYSKDEFEVFVPDPDERGF